MSDSRKSFVDEIGKTLKIFPDSDDLVKLDGLGIFRRVVKEGRIYLQFFDTDRQRSVCRGTRYVEVPLDVIVQFLQPIKEELSDEENKPNQDSAISNGEENPSG